MIHLINMAFRDLGRNRRRSFFSALALGMGLALLLMMAAVIHGEMRSSMDMASISKAGISRCAPKPSTRIKTAWPGKT